MKGLQRSLSRGPKTRQAMVRQTFKIEDLVIAMTGTTGVGYGTAVIGDFPSGQISLISLKGELVITEASADIIDTFDGDVALGTTPLDDGTMSGADVDLVASTAVGPAVASEASVTVAATSTESANIFDNDDGSLEVNLNVLLDDLSISGDDDITVNGYVSIAYVAV